MGISTLLLILLAIAAAAILFFLCYFVATTIRHPDQLIDKMDAELKKLDSMTRVQAEQYKKHDPLIGRKIILGVKLKNCFAKSETLVEVASSVHWKRGRQNWSLAVSFTLPLTVAQALPEGAEITIAGKIAAWGCDNRDTAPYGRNLTLSHVRLLPQSVRGYSNDRV
ncbi:MAG: hypothetical protein V4443_04275 [Pseudomonadota bacterium]